VYEIRIIGSRKQQVTDEYLFFSKYRKWKLKPVSYEIPQAKRRNLRRPQRMRLVRLDLVAKFFVSARSTQDIRQGKRELLQFLHLVSYQLLRKHVHVV
jgi:hypothetical protein